MVRDREAWRAAGPWVSKSRTWLGDFLGKGTTYIGKKEIQTGQLWARAALSLGRKLIFFPGHYCSGALLFPWAQPVPAVLLPQIGVASLWTPGTQPPPVPVLSHDLADWGRKGASGSGWTSPVRLWGSQLWGRPCPKHAMPRWDQGQSLWRPGGKTAPFREKDLQPGLRVPKTDTIPWLSIISPTPPHPTAMTPTLTKWSCPRHSPWPRKSGGSNSLGQTSALCLTSTPSW